MSGDGGKILIRVDAGGPVGLGHLVRCVALAHVLEKGRGCRVLFCANRSPVLEELVRGAGFSAVFNDRELGEEDFLRDLVAAHADAVLFIDHLHPYGLRFIESVRADVPVILFHNDCEGGLGCNAVIFPIAHLDPVVEGRFRRQGALPFYSGFDYVLINQEVRDADRARDFKEPYLALTTGGSDPRGMLLTMLDWLLESDWPQPVVALYGRDFVEIEELKRREGRLSAHIRVEPFSYPALLGARLAVSAFGVTPYELIHREVPVITVGHIEKSAQGSDRLAESSGASISLGLIDDLDGPTFMRVLNHAWSEEIQSAMISRQQGLIDGRGLERIAAIIEEVSALPRP